MTLLLPVLLLCMFCVTSCWKIDTKSSIKSPVLGQRLLPTIETCILTSFASNERSDSAFLKVLTVPIIAGVLAPNSVHATAAESLDLLTGYKAQVPSSVVWTVLLVVSYYVYFKIFQILADW